MSFSISLELLTASSARRETAAAAARFSCAGAHRPCPLPPVLFERFWRRQSRVRLRQEQWQGAAMFGGKSGSRAAVPVRRAGRARVLRIIGGTWRGRKLRFQASAPTRPTPARVRETLFNWLGARTPGARALDLFAGSGALGLEALSRGASHVTFVEHDEAAGRRLSARTPCTTSPPRRARSTWCFWILRSPRSC